MNETTPSRLLDRLESAARRVKPAAVGVAMSAALLASTSPAVQAAGADELDRASAEVQMEVSALAAEAADIDLDLRFDPDSLASSLEDARFDETPDFLPGPGEAEAIVWNQTANWMVAVNEDGEPVYLPTDFGGLDVMTMGSLAERFDHFEGLRGQLEGETLADKVAHDETRLLLGNMFTDREVRAALAPVIRQELFQVPSARYEQAKRTLSEAFGTDRHDPSFLDRVLEEASEDLERKARWEIDDRVDDAIDETIDKLPGIGR